MSSPVQCPGKQHLNFFSPDGNSIWLIPGPPKIHDHIDYIPDDDQSFTQTVDCQVCISFGQIYLKFMPNLEMIEYDVDLNQDLD